MQDFRLEIPSNLLSITFPWETKLTLVSGDDPITLMLRGEGEGKKAGYVTLTTASDGTGVQCQVISAGMRSQSWPPSPSPDSCRREVEKLYDTNWFLLSENTSTGVTAPVQLSGSPP